MQYFVREICGNDLLCNQPLFPVVSGVMFSCGGVKAARSVNSAISNLAAYYWLAKRLVVSSAATRPVANMKYVKGNMSGQLNLLWLSLTKRRGKPQAGVWPALSGVSANVWAYPHRQRRIENSENWHQRLAAMAILA